MGTKIIQASPGGTTLVYSNPGGLPPSPSHAYVPVATSHLAAMHMLPILKLKQTADAASYDRLPNICINSYLLQMNTDGAADHATDRSDTSEQLICQSS